ncbi:hypothetical protein G7046_g6417 [Stylonectria norvegica]|nr:hypothetical protein G7046_g6417 [Stylonectria norvegica]
MSAARSGSTFPGHGDARLGEVLGEGGQANRPHHSRRRACEPHRGPGDSRFAQDLTAWHMPDLAKPDDIDSYVDGIRGTSTPLAAGGDAFRWSREATLVTRYRKIAITAKGYFVVGPDAMAEGDVVAVLYGGGRPWCPNLAAPGPSIVDYGAGYLAHLRSVRPSLPQGLGAGEDCGRGHLARDSVDFLYAMTSTGLFSTEKLYGSVWQFLKIDRED